MNPLLIKAFIGLGIVVALGSWGMLERGEKLVAQAQVRQLRLDEIELGKKIKECNQAVDTWMGSAQAAQKEANDARQKAAEEAGKHLDERKALQAALKAPTPLKAGCEIAWDLIEKARQR